MFTYYIVWAGSVVVCHYFACREDIYNKPTGSFYVPVATILGYKKILDCYRTAPRYLFKKHPVVVVAVPPVCTLSVPGMVRRRTLWSGTGNVTPPPYPMARQHTLSVYLWSKIKVAVVLISLPFS